MKPSAILGYTDAMLTYSAHQGPALYPIILKTETRFLTLIPSVSVLLFPAADVIRLYISQPRGAG